MAKDALPLSLQESVLTTLVFDAANGVVVAAQVEPELFDEPYREIARRVLEYRGKYGKPPGQAHLDDLFGNLIQEGSRRAPQLRRVLLGLASQSEGLNGEYVASRVSEFVREQRVKQALLRAGERYQQGGEGRLEEVEHILRSALEGGAEQGYDPGFFLDDVKRTLSFLDLTNDFISLGIPELDYCQIGPTPQEMLLYIAPKGSGKTMFSVHCGYQGLLNRQRVVHVTNETRAKRVVGRYYQRIFGGVRRAGRLNQTELEFDSLGRFVKYTRKTREPKLVFSSSDAKKTLRKLIKPWGARLGSLVIRDFPTGVLTVSMLNRYLDYLEKVERFIPTMLIVDSPDLMEVRGSDFRIGTRKNYEAIRGVFMERNLAGVCTTQGTRATIGARRVHSTDVAEDISKVQTADNVLTFARTAAEERLGLGRLHVAHARNEQGGQTILLTQNYPMGQYVVQSAYMDNRYWDQLKDESEDGGDDT